jgi:hypothetical protein
MIGKIFIGVVLIGFLFIQYVVVDRIFKQTNDLNEIYGEITNVEKVQIPKRYFGFNYEYALTLDNEPIRFAIHEKNQRAYDYLSLNHVQGRNTRLFYDKKGHNSQENLTYHVYFIEINGQQILNINESKQTDKKGLIIFIFADLFIIWMIIYLRKKKNNYAQ